MKDEVPEIPFWTEECARLLANPLPEYWKANDHLTSINDIGYLSGMFSNSNYRFAVLDIIPNHLDYTLHQIIKQLKFFRQHIAVMNLSTKAGKPTNPQKLMGWLRDFDPNFIIINGVHGLAYQKELSAFKNAVKIHLWCDDPIMRTEFLGLEKAFEASGKDLMWRHFIWDQEWSDLVLCRWGVMSETFHLAADPDDFYPAKIRQFPDELTFVGNIHSIRAITQDIELLPAVLRRIAVNAHGEVHKCFERGIAVPAWDVLIERALYEITKADCRLYREEAKDKVALGKMRWQVWAMAKNEVRVRMLRNALRVAPVRMFCEMKQLNHANETEIRAMTTEWGNRLRIVNTSTLEPDQLGHLYHSGGLHIQAIDPQSVHSGIPYRVFHCAASARSILTDRGNTLQPAGFTPGEDFECYNDEDEFRAKAKDLLENPGKEDSQGTSAYSIAMKQHTWDTRVKEIVKKAADGAHFPLHGFNARTV